MGIGIQNVFSNPATSWIQQNPIGFLLPVSDNADTTFHGIMKKAPFFQETYITQLYSTKLNRVGPKKNLLFSVTRPTL